ncbi:hypothetical protein [Arcticibacterium luteifluviistationis]|uniref:Uncharacterized protein n=1 Tax=Arcticibacterium luteifluviistationis TaxID=1784714 RepID=A0A2Z4G966_9BACT|nr:hypothetical protein [Arcticibacterium luteifluviistationis]AWV97598.1 hypothetical protein DJ013_05235 [Arcticibacterium luteifluviistationis]
MANLFLIPAVLLNMLHQEGSIETSSFLTNMEGPEVLEIKMGMALPYASEWESPKKGNGLLERNGEFYTLVERNFANDTLYFKYIKNTNAREIFSMLSDKVDNNQDSDKQKDATGNNLLSNWMFLKFKANSDISFAYLNLHFESSASRNFSYENTFSSIYLGIDTPPPRLV